MSGFAWSTRLPLAFAIAIAPNAATTQVRYVEDGPGLQEELSGSPWAFIARQPCQRIDWRPDLRSAAALRASAEPLLRAIEARIGPVGAEGVAVQTSRQVYG